MSEDGDPATVLSLLNDEYARSILAATSQEPMSADALIERFDASPATVYRRLDRLEECGLVGADIELDPDGHHYRVYSARLSSLTVELDDGEFSTEVRTEIEPTYSDVFTDLWEGL